MKTKNEEKYGNLDDQLICLIATSHVPLSRTDLAKLTGLSKMTISRHIASLVQRDLVKETSIRVPGQNMGRIPVVLSLSDLSPCICGTLIKRSYVQTILTDISGKVIHMTKTYNEVEMNAKKLRKTILSQYDELASHTKRKIMGCGIAAIGPVNSETGYILNPAGFYGITNFPVVKIMQEHTHLPVYLLHDASAGALAEKIYGNGVKYNNYIYLHIAEGIGLGFLYNGHLFNGFFGQSGEIGHTSINFNGPRCSCGNNGCLEMYSSVERMREKIQELLPYSIDSGLRKIKQPSWDNIVELAAQGDMVAIAALDEFCTYLARAIENVLNLINFSTLIVGYDRAKFTDIVTRLLSAKLKNYHLPKQYSIRVLPSYFDNAPLIGAVAVVANEIFQKNLLPD